MHKLTLLIDDIPDKVMPAPVTPNGEGVVSAFGLLSHLAKPVTDKQAEDAKRFYMRKRWAAKTASLAHYR